VSEEFKTLKDQMAALEESDARRALLEVTADLVFIDSECREAAFRLIRPEMKKQPDGQYVAANLPLDYYVKNNLEWLPGMLVPSETASDGSKGQRTILGANGPVREIAGAFDINAIKPGMSPETRAQARANIASELAKLGK
jgi:hypothetical protein